MSLKYTCPGCGTPLGYEGLCWKCKCERERNAALAWTPEQIAEKQKNLIQNIQRLAEMEDSEFTDFWQLLGYHTRSRRKEGNSDGMAKTGADSEMGERCPDLRRRKAI